MVHYFQTNKFWSNIALIFKVLLYLYSVVFVQSGINFDECNNITDKMPVMVWLTYEVFVFYLNLFGVVFFLMVSTYAQFKTIRDRLGLAGDMRDRLDFLKYCYDDLHWWQLWFNQVGLYAAGLSFRVNREDALGLSAAQAGVIIFCGAVLMKTIYFKETFEFDTLTKTLLGGLLLITLMLIPRYSWLREEEFTWWSPVVLEIIIAHIMVFVQMLFEWFTLESRKNSWKKDLMFR